MTTRREISSVPSFLCIVASMWTRRPTSVVPYAEEFFKITIKSSERLRPKELYGRNIERIARFRPTLFSFCSFAENYSRGGGVSDEPMNAADVARRWLVQSI